MSYLGLHKEAAANKCLKKIEIIVPKKNTNMKWLQASLLTLIMAWMTFSQQINFFCDVKCSEVFLPLLPKSSGEKHSTGSQR